MTPFGLWSVGSNPVEVLAFSSPGPLLPLQEERVIPAISYVVTLEKLAKGDGAARRTPRTQAAGPGSDMPGKPSA